ncbi:MAG: hypothetical protein LBU70_09075 [Chitinispirillales bacterium]|nr:hypothetical protein [Chitinispirillales bacterium]
MSCQKSDYLIVALKRMKVRGAKGIANQHPTLSKTRRTLEVNGRET